MDNTHELHQHKHFPKVIILSILLIIVMGITFLTLRKNTLTSQTQQGNSTVNQQPNSQQTQPQTNVKNLEIEAPPTATQSEDITLTVKVDSNNRDITAYDILVTYDTEGLTYVKAESLVSGFNIYDYNKDNKITLTGVKSLVNNTQNVFTQTPLVKLTFKPKKAGVYTFTIPAQVGAEKTQLVDSNSQTIQSAEIQTSVTLN